MSAGAVIAGGAVASAMIGLALASAARMDLDAGGSGATGPAVPRSRDRWRRRPILRIIGLRADRVRHRRMDDQVPQLLDLLAAASAAGLSAHQAIERAAEGVGGPLGNELARCIDRVRLGARWRHELADLAERLALGDLQRAVAIMTRSERLGTPLATACAELASSVRHARRSRAMERARTASVKMLFPLVFLVLPAFLLLTVVPVLIATLHNVR